MGEKKETTKARRDPMAVIWARLADVRQMADEIRIKLHLAGMDARARWEMLEPRLVEIERRIAQTGQAAAGEIASGLKQLSRSMRRLRDEIVSTSEQPPAEIHH